MAQRHSTTSDECPLIVQQNKGRGRCNVSGDNIEQPCNGESAADFDTGKYDLLENETDDLSLVGLSKPVVSGTPLSTKRRHKPNTKYADDFVFSSTKKSKRQTVESERRLKQFVVSKTEAKKALLEGDPAGCSSDKADHAVSPAKTDNKELPCTSDVIHSKGFNHDVKRRGRKPKHHGDISLTEAKNVESGNLPSSLSLSPRGVQPQLGEKTSRRRGRKSQLANTSLPNESLTIESDSLSARREVQISVSKKCRRPPKNLVGELSHTTCTEDAKHSHENSLTEKGSISSGNLTVPRRHRQPQKNSIDAEGSENKFVCVQCSETLSSLWKLKSHMAQQHHLIWSGENKAAIFSPAKVFQLLKRISCLKCGKLFKVYGTFTLHVRWCGRENEMTKCEICEQEILLRLYNNHMLRAHRPKPDKEHEQAALVDVDGNRSFGRGSRTAAQKARQLWKEIGDDEVQPSSRAKSQTENFTQPLYTCRDRLPRSYVRKCSEILIETGNIKCCYADCTAVFTVLETMLEHLWTCDLRSKFMDRSSEQFVCLECGKCFKGEKCTQNHIRKQHPNKITVKFSDSETSLSSNESDSDSESESSSDSEVKAGRSSTGLPSTRSTKYVHDTGRIVNDYYSFCAKQQTATAVFLDWKPDSELFNKISPEDLPSVLPVNQQLSFSIQISSNVTELPQLPLFGSFQSRDAVHVNVGGPVWSLAWCPVNCSQTASQYLSVYTHRHASDSHSFDQPSCDAAVIQLYNCGILGSRSCSDDKPELVYGLVLNCGPVWEMKWCPARVWQPPVNDSEQEAAVSRLGLLAVATHSGHIHILAMPHEDQLSSVTDKSVSWYQATPSVTLTQYSVETSCLCLDWSLCNDFAYIAAGFADGSVSVWDLHTKSSLLRSCSVDGRTVILRPFRTVSAYLLPVSSIVFCQRVPFMLASCSLDRTVRTWDIREPVMSLTYRGTIPLSSASDRTDVDVEASADGGKAVVRRNADSQKSLTGLLRKVVWPVSTVCTFCCASDECYLHEMNRCIMLRLGLDSADKWKSRSLTIHNASVWDLSFSEWLQSLVSCDSVGLVMACEWPHREVKCMALVRQVIFTTELVHTALDSDEAGTGSSVSESVSHDDKIIQKGKGACSDGNKASISSMDNDANVTDTALADTDANGDKDRPRKIVFKDYYMDSNWNYDNPLNFPKNMPTDTIVGSRYAALHRLAWNPNLGSHQWLAVAGNAGLLRILCVHTAGSHHAAKLCTDLQTAQSANGTG